MENETPISENDSSIVYIIGAVIVVALVVAGVLLWPKMKPNTSTTATTTTTPSIEQKSGNITKLSCGKQWYNPMIGFAKYYLSADGEALTTTKSVDCTFTVTSADNKVIATENQPAVLTDVPTRDGKTFICTTKAIDLPKGTKVTMITAIKDDSGMTASCAAGAITLP